MPENKTFVNESGNVRIADEVIAAIVGTAVLEAEGVTGLSGHFIGEIAGKARKKTSKGVALQIADGNVTVSLGIVVKYGCKVQRVACDVQERVKNAIETMTGFTASEVNVTVVGLAA